MFIYSPSIQCDGCNRVYQPSWNPIENQLCGRVKMASTCNEVRLEAYNIGWRRYDLLGAIEGGPHGQVRYIDLCPHCVKTKARGKLCRKPSPLHSRKKRSRKQ